MLIPSTHANRMLTQYGPFFIIQCFHWCLNSIRQPSAPNKCVYQQLVCKIYHPYCTNPCHGHAHLKGHLPYHGLGDALNSDETLSVVLPPTREQLDPMPSRLNVFYSRARCLDLIFSRANTKHKHIHTSTNNL